MKRRLNQSIGILLSVLMIATMIPFLPVAAASNPFRDVDENHWCYNSLLYVYENGLMNGTSNTTFEPDTTMSRAMVVTVLYRMEGTPKAASSTFKDVPSGQWYTDAVAWASSVGVVNGFSSDKFGPSDNVTREQIATILYRYAGQKNYDTSKSTSLRGYSDYGKINDWAREALSWANAESLIVGMGDNTLAPRANATRAQVATVLQRFHEKYVKGSYGTDNPEPIPVEDPEKTNEKETYTINFDYNYGDKGLYKTAEVKRGEMVQYPGNPDRSGYIFAGWYLDKNEQDLSNQYNFSNSITNDTVLYAQWINGDVDSDRDGIPDDLEGYFKTDIMNADTDGDGLSDYQECIMIGLNPTLMDTDGNGVSDYNEDADGDGLSNGKEVEIGTIPVAEDSDIDGLLDGDEWIIYNTNPNNKDTDGDGASDAWEIDHSFNPTVYNNSFDISVRSQAAHVTATASVNLTGERAETVNVEPVVDHGVLTSSIPGYIDIPFEFKVEDNLKGESATISFTFDNALNYEYGFEPCIYYYDEETQLLEAFPTTVTGNSASTLVNHFSTYILLNKTKFDEVWEKEIRPPLSTGKKNEDENLDVMFVIDYSASMDWNDPNKLFISLAKQFVNKLREGKDQAGAVKFIANATLISELSTDKMSVIDAIDSIVYDDGYGSDSGTNGSAGIKEALNELEKSSDKYRYIIFITDGDDNRSSYSYESLAQEAASEDIVVYAIGMGSANESNLRLISDNTGGKYYHATVDTDAYELINLDDVFDEIESETVDLTKDTDADGIPDYYEAKLTTGSGIQLHLDPKNPDCDDDGLKDGEEIKISVSEDNHVYAKMISNPRLFFSDSDIYNDYDEVNVYHTNPLIENISFEEADTSFLINDENFISDKYMDFYDNKWYGWTERASVWLGNNFFDSNGDTTYLYKTMLIDYLEQMVEESQNTKELEEAISFTLKISKEMNDNIGSIFEYVEQDSKDYLENLQQQLRNCDKELNGILNSDLVNKGFTKEQVYKLSDETFSHYRDAQEKVPQLESKIEISSKISKGTKVVGVALNVADVIKSTYDLCNQYHSFASSISSMDDCLSVLDVIRNSSNAPTELKNAANEVYRAIEEKKVANLDSFFDLASVTVGKSANILLTGGMTKIPVVGKYLVAIKEGGDFVFNISDVAKECSRLYAISKSANIVAKDFSNTISNSSKFRQWQIIYLGYQNAVNDYYNLAIIRKVGENQMQNANKANSFLIEWFFTNITYKTDTINSNINRIDSIKNKYLAV